MKINTENFLNIAKEQIHEPHAKAVLDFFPLVLSMMRDDVFKNFPDPDKAMEYSGAIRAQAIAELPELLERFEKNALKAGAKVVWARDSHEANTYILNLAKEKKIKYVTKGKSMVTEELGLNEALAEEGIQAFEADLGEFIAQLDPGEIFRFFR